MEFTKLPFNIKILKNDKSILTGIQPVTVADIYTTNNEYHPQGLYSFEIFGPLGSEGRFERFSYIDLKLEIIHPKVWKDLVRTKGLYASIMAGKEYAIWDSTLCDFIKSNIIDGQTGYNFFITNYQHLKLQENDSDKRSQRIMLIEKTRSKDLYSFLIVIPAGLRELEINEDGREKEDDIAGLYRKVIRAAATISLNDNIRDFTVYDSVRWTMQKTINEIYEYIISPIGGKKGILQGKVASRGIHNSTRNVITAMDPAPAFLDDPYAISVNDTLSGLHQYLKGNVERSIYDVRNGPMQPILSKLPALIPVVDRYTLRQKEISPSDFITETWGTAEGIEKLFNGYGKLDARHKPIIIDGDYAALVYQDDKCYRVFYDITELPDNFSKDNVKPLTWTECFTLSVFDNVKYAAGYCTRYPTTDLGNSYPTLIKLKSTIKDKRLYRLTDQWVKDESPDNLITCFPITGEPFFESMSPHPSKIKDAGADFDGDMMNLTFLTSDEGREELHKYFTTPAAYTDTIGGLKYGVNDHIAALVLYSFTRGLISQ